MKTATSLSVAPHADDPRWQVVCARDSRYDGQFVFAVRTTGIFCRPSCRSRRPLRENVAFYPDADAALSAGFRPCKRCQPHKLDPLLQRQAKVEQACRLLEQDTPVSLNALANAVAMSPWHFHRLFKHVTGMTPKNWQQAWRARRLQSTLTQSHTITEAVLAAGFPDNSSYYRQADAALGMTASQYRRGGNNTAVYYALSRCSLGHCLVAESERGICAVLLADSEAALLAELQQIFPHAQREPGSVDFAGRVAEVVRRINDPRSPFSLPLDLRGTAFQLQVWQALRALDPGQTISYQTLATRIGKPTAVRAVARACGANTLAIVVPCHRVVRADGGVSGYRWGATRKARLLQQEAEEKERGC
ncbi:bifunctional DNA-binding transcriptional regulator/O6-methylguanine-DNA methyltransferase Ada [Yokenella regensburgei]|uniref:bifunctional DNA-binding transcriptional regulator/O6-methylguanine-DNA methyltransferase Ada n=1 Tax=Yokenella regensburgei TaxID=158877 RepID=UPI003F13C37F